jgi:hypothetical protein
MTTLDFTLYFTGPDLQTGDNLDTLSEAGLDKATFGSRDDEQLAIFSHNEETLGEGIDEAISSLEGALPGISVTRVEIESLSEDTLTN